MCEITFEFIDGTEEVFYKAESIVTDLNNFTGVTYYPEKGGIRVKYFQSRFIKEIELKQV